MIRKTKWILLLLLTIVFSLQLRTAAVQPQSSDIGVPNGVLIRNGSNQRIAFWLRNGSSKWVPLQLEAGANKVYKDVDQIWIPTADQQPVHYKLEEKQRYKIFWNGTKWDVNKISIRR